MVNSKIQNFSKTFALQLFLPADSGIDWDIATGIAMDIADAGGFDSSQYAEIYSQIIDILDPIIEETTGCEAKKHVPLVLNRHEWIITTIESVKRMFGEVIDEYWKNLQENLKGSYKGIVVKKSVKSTLTAEMGLLIGYISGKVLAQYDLIIPEKQNACLYFIEPNIALRRQQLGADLSTFRFWITLHELAHKFQFDNNPWIRKYYFDLLDETKKIIKEPVKNKSSAGINNISLLMNPKNRNLIEKIQAFMSIVEGYADFIMFTAAKYLPDYEQTAPIFQKKKSNDGILKEIFNKMLGLDMKLDQYRMGYQFISSVAQAHSLSFFQENLKDGNSVPTLNEINKPELWVKRVTS